MRTNLKTKKPKEDPHGSLLEMEFVRGREMVLKEYIQFFARLQQKFTQTPDSVKEAKEQGKKQNGMGGYETEIEIRDGCYNTGARAVIIKYEEQVVGFQTFSIDPVSIDIYQKLMKYKDCLPEHLRSLGREDIGRGGTVIIDKDLPGTDIDLPSGQYEISHTVMMQKQRITGKVLVIDWCFTGNEVGLSAHEKMGYKVLQDKDGNRIEFESPYITEMDAGKKLYMVYCEVDTDHQRDLRKKVLQTIEKHRVQCRLARASAEDPTILRTLMKHEKEIIDLLRRPFD